MSKRLKRKKIISVTLVLIWVVLTLLPIYWMVNTSLKTNFEVYSKIPTLYPHEPTLQNYKDLFVKTKFLSGIKNSLIISIVSATFSILVAFPAAYAVSRLRFNGKKFMSRTILFCYLIPASVLYIPLFIILYKLGLTDTRLGLMLIYPTATVPYAAWMLIPNLRSVPLSIEEAALIDGCSRGQVITKIMLPLAFPCVISTFIFTFGACWGEYLYALVNINSESLKTYPLILSGLIFGDMFPWGEIMAGGVLASIPLILIYVLLSNFLITGTTEGGVKG